MRETMATAVALCALLLGTGCGGGTQAVAGGAAAPSAALDARALLRRFAATNTTVLRVPEGSIEDLEGRMRSSRGMDRRHAMRDLAAAHVLAAGENQSRTARHHRSEARTLIDRARRRLRDPNLRAELLFLRMWMSWDSGRGNTGAHAERLIHRHGEAGGPLVALAWMIKGELAFEDEHYERAITAFRFVRGDLRHPLYAYAMYRTSQCWSRLGREEEAREGLLEVERLGCAEETVGSTLVLSLRAARELGNETAEDLQGTERPVRCQQESTNVNIEEERPPALQ